MKTLMALLFLALLISGCTGVKEIRTVSTPTKIYIQHPSLPDQLNLKEVKFIVVNKQKILDMLGCVPAPKDSNLTYVCEENTKYTEDDFVWITLTPQKYENMSLNMRELKRYLEEQKEIIIFYRDTITNYNADTEKK